MLRGTLRRFGPVPPISYVREAMIIRTATSPLAEEEWAGILSGWARLSRETQSEFRSMPLRGLKLPRRFARSQSGAKARR